MAEHNRWTFREAGVVVIDVVGPRGAGKTSLLAAARAALPGFIRAAVLSGGRGRVGASWLRRAVRGLDLEDLDYLFIEREGSLRRCCAVDLGQTARVVVLPVTGAGAVLCDEPEVLASADLLVLSKVDLPAHVEVRSWLLRDGLEILEVSCKALDGVDAWVDWVQCPTSLVPFDRPALATSAFGGGA